MSRRHLLGIGAAATAGTAVPLSTGPRAATSSIVSHDANLQTHYCTLSAAQRQYWERQYSHFGMRAVPGVPGEVRGATPQRSRPLRVSIPWHVRGRCVVPRRRCRVGSRRG
ncbi:hypothetical protein ACFYR1_19080 [Streptomyces canus]|uniref:hypothetical protein n=1 Tax=Streptomyces canus TaxID=58343 RepID=UPI003679F342